MYAETFPISSQSECMEMYLNFIIPENVSLRDPPPDPFNSKSLSFHLISPAKSN